MDSLDLLAREEEFKRLNKQLVKKSDSLIKQIEHVMQKQDFFTEFSHNLSFNSKHNFKKHCCESISITPEHHTPVKSKKKEKITPSKVKQEHKQCITAPNQLEGFKFENGTYKECIRTPNQSAGLEFKNETHKERIEIPNQLENLDNNDFDCLKAKCENSAQIVCDCCSISKMDRTNGDFEFLHAFVSVSVQDKILPPSFLKDRVSVESLCKFMSSKVKLMQEQIDKLQITIDKKASHCETHLTKLAELESERMTLLNKANNIKAESADVKAKNAHLLSKLNEKDRLYKEQRSETDKLTSEVKRLRSKNATLEAKSSSYEETIDSLKLQLDNSKRAEKEFRDSTRSLSTSHQNAIQKLEIRAKTLSARIDKQNELIDNLRRQNAILATEGVLKALEKEYCKFLTQDF